MSFTRGRIIAEMALKDGTGRKTEQGSNILKVNRGRGACPHS